MAAASQSVSLLRAGDERRRRPADGWVDVTVPRVLIHEAAVTGATSACTREPAPSPLRWRMISLAFLATVINYLDRQTLSVAAPILREQFHMSNEDYSRVVIAFLFAYTIMNGVSGPMIDRLGTRLGYGLCVRGGRIAAALHAFARGPFSLGVFRFLLGMGEAGNWPGAVKVVAEWFPEKRARARLRALQFGLRGRRDPGAADGRVSDSAVRLAGRVRLRRARRPALAGLLVRRCITRPPPLPGAPRRSASPGRGSCCAAASSGPSPSPRSSWTRSGTSTFSGFPNT